MFQNKYLFKNLSLDGILVMTEDKETEMIIVASIKTLKRNSKNLTGARYLTKFKVSCKVNSTCEIFDELFQDMTESNVVKFRTVGGRKCLSLSKEETKDLDMAAKQDDKQFSHFSITT